MFATWIVIASIALLSIVCRWLLTARRDKGTAQPVPAAAALVNEPPADDQKAAITDEDTDRLFAQQLQMEWAIQDEDTTLPSILVVSLPDETVQQPPIVDDDDLIQQQQNVDDEEDLDDGFDDYGFDEFRMGDERDFGLTKMSSKAANGLKQFAGARHKKTAAKSSKDKKTKKRGQTKNLAIDNATRVLLDKLVDSGVLSAVHGVVCAGKESVVVQASGSSSNDVTIPAECALKIFKTTSKGKGRAHEHIENDGRYGKRYKRGASAAKNVTIWAEKEMQNLVRMRKAGILCPEPVMLKKNILVMELILGQDGQPAPKLADVASQLTAEQVDRAYQDVVQSMRAMYTGAKLVHSDLSEFNLLYHDGRCYLIDVSQAVEPWDPNADEFLLRDCANVVRFFDRLGASDLMSAEELRDSIIAG